jgi:hypothetical protein
MIYSIVKKFVNKSNILLITSNYQKKNSSDVDIYCVTTGKSFVNIFYDKKYGWVEIFSDNINDVYKKIENVDEIAINFINEMDYIYGDKSLLSELLTKTKMVIENYQIPERRKNIIKYRIKTLLSKYLNPDDTTNLLQQKFIVNSLSYPILQLALEYYKIFPSSPKRWLSQLESKIPKEDFKEIEDFLNNVDELNTVKKICTKYCGELDNISFDKSKNNDITFIS